MAEDGGAACCRCCFSFIFTSGLTALFMWLSLRTYKPTCYIQQFYLPALNTIDNSAAARRNHSVAFDLKLQNAMKDKGVNYAAINMTFSYYQNNSRLPIANYTLPGFCTRATARKPTENALVNFTGVPWAAVFGAVSAGSTVKFRVDLATRVKYKIMFWYTKRHTVAVGGDVEVGGGGWKVKRKPIKMKSGVPDPRRHWVRVGTVAFLTLFIILLL